MFERVEETRSRFGHVWGDVAGTGGGRFKVFDQGAHITEWSPGGAPVLFTSSQALYQPGKAIRGGIPICFPWFADGRDGRSTPAHGPARLTDWRLTSTEESEGVTSLEWRLDAADIAGVPGAEQAPRQFEVVCRQRFGEQLAVQLRVRNTGSSSVTFEAALHTYYQVADIERVTLEGLGGSEYTDKATGETTTQRGDVTFTQETDRVYQSDADVTIVDPGLDRRIVVAKQNSATTVVWNPWDEKARGMADLADTEWRRFVCVETANAGDDAIHLDPGESHSMRLTVCVEAI